MVLYRDDLPLRTGDVFISDGGLETELIFSNGWDLPENAAFVLLETRQGRRALVQYYRRYLWIAKEYDVGFILESPTWRASWAWMAKMAYRHEVVAAVNRDAIALLGEIKDEFETESMPIVISGCMGPRGDGYVVQNRMTVEEARRYHAEQIEVFRQTEADMVSAHTLNYIEEAVGIALAAQAVGMPSVISFTVEVDGALPSGQTVKEAIQTIDEATGSAPVYYMLNCAHPTHMRKGLVAGEPWIDRIGGIRANASARSHAELNSLKHLDRGDPEDFGRQYKKLCQVLPRLHVFGGCCGTDHRHVAEICRACLTANVSRVKVGG